MASAFDYTVQTPVNNGAEIGVTRSGDLVFRQEYQPGLSTRVNLGKATKTNIDRLRYCLDRLEVHAVE